jgi:ABC-type antimicrobial peptide transport system permease subunit
LAGVGLAGLLGYSVTTRQREFGVRLAVGATPAQLQRTVLSEASVLVTVGIVVGLAAGGAAAHAVRALLFGVGPADAASYAMAIGLLGATGVIASWWPAHRASTVSPTDALRTD